jgi:hypothetical protein
MVRCDIWAPLRLAGIEMLIKIDPSVLGETKWYQYFTRFLLGGTVTAVAGIIAKDFGPGIGGLFLAFPAIFPASATLIEKHEKEKQEKEGLDGTLRAREAAGLDAAGSAMGSIGLLVFALCVWQFLPRHSTWEVLTGAAVAWLVVSVLVWHVRKRV